MFCRVQTPPYFPQTHLNFSAYGKYLTTPNFGAVSPKITPSINLVEENSDFVAEIYLN